jgi:hypothetical protein
MTEPQSVSHRYIDAINRKDLDALDGLLADSVVLNHPMGTFEGRDAVIEFYRDTVFFAGTKLVARGPVLRSPEAEAIEVVGKFPEDNGFGVDIPDQYAIDAFRVEPGGRVVGIDIYYRSFIDGSED